MSKKKPRDIEKPNNMLAYIPDFCEKNNLSVVMVRAIVDEYYGIVKDHLNEANSLRVNVRGLGVFKVALSRCKSFAKYYGSKRDRNNSEFYKDYYNTLTEKFLRLCELKTQSNKDKEEFKRKRDEHKQDN